MSVESKEQTLGAVNNALDETWATELLAKLRRVAFNKQWITIDDLWKLNPNPTGDQAKVGAIMRRASSRSNGKIPFLRPTPYRVFSQRGNHDNIMLWESIIFLSGDETMPEIATLHADPSLDLDSMVRLHQKAKEWYDAGHAPDYMPQEMSELITTIFTPLELDS